MYSKWSTVQNKLTSGRKINDKICLTNTVNPNRIDPSSQVNTENLKLLYSVHCTVHCTDSKLNQTFKNRQNNRIYYFEIKTATHNIIHYIF